MEVFNSQKKKTEMEVFNSKKKKTLLPLKNKMIELPFFRIVVRLSDDDRNLGWLKLDPEDYWSSVDKTAYCDHLHSSNSSKNFFTDVVDLKHNAISFCKYPVFCYSVCIKSTVYCVGGDNDIDGDVGDIFSERIGPPITKRPLNYKFNPPRKNNLSHKIGSYDFFYPPRGEEFDWKLDNAPILQSPRYRPCVVTVGGRIFLFGGNRFPVNQLDYIPFAEVFDPRTKQCSLVSDPPFPSRLGYQVLFVAPFLSSADGQQKILVMSRAISVKPPLGADAAAIYDVHTDTWDPFPDPERQLLLHKAHDIIGTPVPVAHQDSIYWLRSRYKKKPAIICSYNWKTKHFWEGTIFGLQHELSFQRINDSSKTLLHLYQDLFFIVWDDMVSCDDDVTHIHFTLLRVCREDPPSSSLSAFVLGCFSHILPISCEVHKAFLLR